MEKDHPIAWRLIRRLESVRAAEKLSIPDFASRFDVSKQAYYKWLKAVRMNLPIKIRITAIEAGLKELGYDAWIIIEKRERGQ